MTDLVIYRLTSADPVDAPLVTLSGVPVRANSVEVAPLIEDEEIDPNRFGSALNRRGAIRAYDVTLRVLPRELDGRMMTAHVRPVDPDGVHRDADGNGSYVTVLEDPYRHNRPIIDVDGQHVCLDEDEAWALLCELAAIIGRPERHPAHVWERDYPDQAGCVVVDPDGWREPDAPEWDTPITLDEYRRRAAHSTANHHPDPAHRLRMRGWFQVLAERAEADQ